MRTLVIAEAGSTWWPGSDHLPASFPRMNLLIRIAKKAGADVCKFQWCSNGIRLAERRNVLELALLYCQLLEWPRGWHAQLKDECDFVGLEYMCSVYLPEDLPVIAPYVRRFKISSLESQNRAFIEAVCAQGKPVLTSTGLTAHDAALIAPMRPGNSLLHCVSAYPTPPSDANLAVITHWRQVFRRITIGFSDHTGHVLTGALAVAAGAQVIEVHIRLEDTPSDNPDYPHSLTPTQLADYIRHVRLAETMLGDGVKKIEESERANLKYRVKE